MITQFLDTIIEVIRDLFSPRTQPVKVRVNTDQEIADHLRRKHHH